MLSNVVVEVDHHYRSSKENGDTGLEKHHEGICHLLEEALQTSIDDVVNRKVLKDGQHALGVPSMAVELLPSAVVAVDRHYVECCVAPAGLQFNRLTKVRFAGVLPVLGLVRETGMTKNRIVNGHDRLLYDIGSSFRRK